MEALIGQRELRLLGMVQAHEPLQQGLLHQGGVEGPLAAVVDAHRPSGARLLIGDWAPTSGDLNPIAHCLLVLRGQANHVPQGREEPSQTIEPRRLCLVRSSA